MTGPKSYSSWSSFDYKTFILTETRHHFFWVACFFCFVLFFIFTRSCLFFLTSFRWNMRLSDKRELLSKIFRARLKDENETSKPSIKIFVEISWSIVVLNCEILAIQNISWSFDLWERMLRQMKRKKGSTRLRFFLILISLCLQFSVSSTKQWRTTVALKIQF